MATGQSTVIYREIPGFPGYRVGDDGSVWTCWRGHGIKELGTIWRPMKGSPKKEGHLQVELVNDGLSRTTRFIHRLVLEAFVGPCPDGLEACHGDGDPTNNVLSNLRWDTKKANMADQVTHGVRIKGETHPLAKLNPDGVRAIRADYAAGVTVSDISRRRGISRKTIRNILDGKIWREVV